jgi:hypothetical protein
MWWPHTQGCASLALGWRMLAFQAKETTATTAKSAGNSASPKATQSRDARDTRGRDALATRDNGEDEGKMPSLHATTAKNRDWHPAAHAFNGIRYPAAVLWTAAPIAT